MKKLYFSLIAFCFLCFANAQIVNIPDANFKAKLLAADVNNQIAQNSLTVFIKIDSNSDGEIQESEALQVSSLNLNYSNISDVTGIAFFLNINSLYCNSNQLTNLNISSNLALVSLDCSSNQITNLNLYNNISLLGLDCSQNQLSGLDVSNNVQLGGLNCSSNQLTEINVNFNTSLTTLVCFSNQLTNLKLNNNFALFLLDCSDNQLISLNLNNNSQVTQLFCEINNLNSLNVSNLNDLTVLKCYSNQLTALNVSNCQFLTTLWCSSNQLTSLNLDSNTALVTLFCESNQLQSLNLNYNILLKFIRCYFNQLTSINLNNNLSLIDLYCEGNQLSNLDLSANAELQNLSCNNNQLTNLILTNNINLIDLSCNNNQLTSLNLTTNTKLTKVSCISNLLTNLNLENNTKLDLLFCFNNQLTSLDVNSNFLLDLNCQNNLLTSLFIKNNSNETNLDFSYNPNLNYICADESQIATIRAQIVSNGMLATCNVNSYCSFTPGGTFYTIQGNSKYDENNNDCDALDLAFPNLKLYFSDGINSGAIIPDNSGNYHYEVQEGTHTITPILENPSYFDVSPTTATVTFPATTSPAIQDFCITANGVHNDLEVSILTIDAARPDFDANYKIIYKNKGNQTQTGLVNFTFDDAVLDFVSANPVATSQVLNDLSFGFSNLLPFESREISVVFNLNSPMETPALNSGNILNYTTTITNTTDETPLDNTFSLNQTVVNSFDPNDKTCLEGNKILPAKVGDYVNYMIRFENTGTFPAQNIVVKDMVDMTKFDINSLIPVKGSHSFVTRITETNKVEFIFENINLPFDNANNDGYVAFKIKTKSTLVLGNTFSNSASIYFDYNFPIVTDPAVTKVSNALANRDFEFSNYFNIYPNPVKNVLNINNKSNIEVSSIGIYNTLGQLVQINTKPSQTIDVSELKSGNYFIKIVSNKGTSNSKFIKE